MKPDVIVTWPRNCDYPLWRQFIRNNRDRFNQVFIGLHKTNTARDYSEFIKGAMAPDNVNIFNAPEPNMGIGDWRDLSVNAALLQSHAEWVWFTEQDFYPEDGFWTEVNQFMAEQKQAIFVYEGVRIHPCCLFAKREVIDKARKNFAILPNAGDHFCMFAQDLLGLKVKAGVIAPKYYNHYNGLSQNWYLASEGQQPNYRPEDFVKWLKLSMAVEVPMYSDFANIANAVISAHDRENEQITVPSPTPPPPKEGSFEADRGDTP